MVNHLSVETGLALASIGCWTCKGEYVTNTLAALETPLTEYVLQIVESGVIVLYQAV